MAFLSSTLSHLSPLFRDAERPGASTHKKAAGKRGAKPAQKRGSAAKSAKNEKKLDDNSDIEPPKRPRTYGREAAALVLMALGIYFALALASFEADPVRARIHGENWVGPVGEVAARWTVEFVGVVAWLLPLELLLTARPLLLDRKLKFNLARISGNVLLVVIGCALAHIAFPRGTAFGNMPLGGVVGVLFGNIARGLFSTAGSFLTGITAISLILIQRSTFSFIEVAQFVRTLAGRVSDALGRAAAAVRRAWTTARQRDAEERERRRQEAEPIIASPEQADAIIAAFADEGGDASPAGLWSGGIDSETPQAAPQLNRGRTLTPPPVSSRRISLAPDGLGMPETTSVGIHDAPTPRPSATSSLDADALSQAKTPVLAKSLKVQHGGFDPDSVSMINESQLAIVNKRAPRKKKSTASDEPKIVDTSKIAETKRARRRAKSSTDTFTLPNPELLDPKVDGGHRHDPDQLKATGRLLEKTLADYRIEGKVQEIHPGPTVTMFEVSPAPGTKVSKVAGLADDLALGLSRKVRIIAPIPGKARIGFEVPNKVRLPVNLRELIESEDFMSMKAPLPCVLGRDIIGRPFFADLASMPHVIVAGATGAGKSVGLNVMLISLLYRRSPEDLRLLMIDPKVVELAPFDKIPHLLFPVVTDMKQAANALRWTVDEMERRYQLFADAGTKNITTYNRYVKRVGNGELPMPKGPKIVDAIGPDGVQLEVPAAKDGSDAELPKKLPYIVIVIEEFADLMMTQGKDVESSVARLAQKARAAGLHVILATQRPSVDVITGMIKANFPTRIAYRVSQKTDARTILDQQGAEALLGKGDMLVKLNGSNDIQRVQCPFVSEEEVQRVTDMLRSQGEPDYDETIVMSREAEDGSDSKSGAENDPLYDQAVQVVGETKKCSTSWLQRKLGVGYNRAAKIVEAMEEHGIVGPPNGSKPREILIHSH